MRTRILAIIVALLAGSAQAQMNGGAIRYTPGAVQYGYVVEEFNSGLLTSGSVGTNGWNVANMTPTLIGEAGHPGILHVLTNAASVETTLYGNYSGYGTVLSEIKESTFIVRAFTAENVPDVRVGWSGNVGNVAAAGAWFEALAADTNWFAVTRDSAVAGEITRTDTGVAVQTNVWLTMGIRMDGTVVRFSINGVNVAAHEGGADHVPAAGTGLQPLVKIVSKGTAVAIDVDFFRVIYSVVR